VEESKSSPFESPKTSSSSKSSLKTNHEICVCLQKTLIKEGVYPNPLAERKRMEQAVIAFDENGVAAGPIVGRKNRSQEEKEKG